VVDVLNHAGRIRRSKLQEGCSVQTGVYRLSPRVTGNWISASSAFNPDEHKVTLDVAPSADMRKSLAEAAIEVLGVKDSGAFIGLVTDITTGKIHGTLTSGGQIKIAEDKIKLEPLGGEGIGVVLHGESGDTQGNHRGTAHASAQPLYVERGNPLRGRKSPTERASGDYLRYYPQCVQLR
jgi:hypothetical protein